MFALSVALSSAAACAPVRASSSTTSAHLVRDNTDVFNIEHVLVEAL
jgi:hypothetical protein